MNRNTCPTPPGDCCHVCGLPIERRPEWENIQVSNDYQVSFYVIGNRILYSIPVGSASDEGSFGFIEHRKRVLRESGLYRRGYAEIADYAFFRGSPSKEVRLYFKQVIMEEVAAGKLAGIWVFNTPTVIRWYYNVGGAIYKNKLPVEAVKQYSDAVGKALKALGETEITAPGEALKPDDAVQLRLESYQDELLHYIGSINWDAEGLPEEPGNSPHPFAQVFGALGILKQDMDDLNRRNRDTARELAAMNRQLEARNTQLRALTDYLIHTEEREKKKIADDLHDGIAQTIALLIAKVKTSSAQKTPMNPAELLQIQELLEQSLKEMRTLSFELSPPELESGLMPGLEWLMETLESRYGLDLELAVLIADPPELDQTLTIVLYRAVHELIRNVMKHSGKKAARIIVSEHDRYLKILVEDRGRGFDTSLLDDRRPSTFGLFSISERLDILDGHMHVVSEPGQGTRITLWAPIDSGDDDNPLARLKPPFLI